jgi:hypothetical protein
MLPPILVFIQLYELPCGRGIMLQRSSIIYSYKIFAYSCIALSLFVTSARAEDDSVGQEPGAAQSIQEPGAPGSPRTIDLGVITDFAKKLTTDIRRLNYHTAREIVVSIPQFNQELVIHWGFSGSEDIFSPMPQIPVQLRPILPQPGEEAQKFSLKELGAALAQDALAQHISQLPLLRWITQAQFTPARLFYLKLFMLAQTYQQHHSMDPFALGNEILRLLIKLSLAENPGIETTIISQHIPEPLRTFINDTIPYVIEIIDTLWLGLKDKTITLDPVQFARLCPRAVYAIPVATNSAAALYLATLQQRYTAQEFMAGKGVLRFTSIGTAFSTSRIPKELNDAAQKATMFPQFIKAEDTHGHHWVACITDQLELIDSVKMSALILARTIAEYTSIHAAYLKSNPDAAKKHQDRCAQDTKRQLRLQAFLQSKAGKDSTQRIETKLTALEQKIEHSSDQSSTETIEAHVKKLDVRKQELLTALNKAQTTYDVYTHALQLGQNATTINEKMAIARHEREALEHELAEIEQLRATAVAEMHACGIADPELVKELEKLQLMAAEFEKIGEEIPANLRQKIATLENRIDAQKPSQDKRNAHCTQVYQDELGLLEQQLATEQIRIEALPEEQRELARLYYTRITQPQYKTYSEELQQKIISLTSESQAQSSDTTHDLGFIVSGVEFQEMLRDFNENNPAYAPLKQKLFNAMEYIMNKSLHIRKFSRTFRYAIANYLPEFLPAFDRAAQS